MRNFRVIHGSSGLAWRVRRVLRRGTWRPVLLAGVLLALVFGLPDLGNHADQHANPDISPETGWRRNLSIGPEWFNNGATDPWRGHRPPNPAPPTGAPGSAGGHVTCANPAIIDGDTLDCGGRRIRLQGIDAPELPGHCPAGKTCAPGDPNAARNHLRGIAAGTVTCDGSETDRYGRNVARCNAAGRDLSCEMIRSGHAIRRYGEINCP